MKIPKTVKKILKDNDISQDLLEAKINKELRTKNRFYWGCYIGVAYTKDVHVWRVDANERIISDENFRGVAILKYGNPYNDTPGEIVEWLK